MTWAGKGKKLPLIGHFQVTLYLCFKTSRCANLSCKIELICIKNEHVGGMHFTHIRGVAIYSINLISNFANGPKNKTRTVD